MGLHQYGWKYSTGTNVSTTIRLPFPFKYNGIEFDLSNYPYNIEYSVPDVSGRIYGLWVRPTQSVTVTLGYNGYNPYRGYPLLMYSPEESSNTGTSIITGPYIIPKLIQASYSYPLSTVIVNFTVDGKPKRYVTLCGGQPWSRHNPSSSQKLNGYSFGWAYEYPELNTEGITEPVDYELANKSLISSEIREELVGKIIDFGSEGQIVPKWFKDWFVSVFESAILKVTISILSPTGTDTRLTQTLPQVDWVIANQVDGVQYFTFHSADGSSTNASYTIPTVTGKKLVGFSTQPNALIPEISANTGEERITVNWDSDTVLYEVWQKSAPSPSTIFPIVFYASSAEMNRVDKTSYLQQLLTINGALRDECSFTTPSIVIESSITPSYNYAYIAAFERYYFITDIVSVGKNLWEIYMQVDVLHTYRAGIKSLTGLIDRSETFETPDITDNLRAVKNGYDVEESVMAVSIFPDGIGRYVVNGFSIDVDYTSSTNSDSTEVLVEDGGEVDGQS